MEIQYQYISESGILIATIIGTYEISDDTSVVENIVNRMKKHKCSRVLFDYRDADFVVDTLSAYDRPDVLDRLGVKRTVKFASLYQKLDVQTRYTENVYRNRGWRMRDFTDFDAAIEWLAKP